MPERTDTVEYTADELAEARRIVAAYRDRVLAGAEGDGLPADYEDGYQDGLAYALKMMGHRDG